MQDCSVEGVHKMFGGWNEILLLGKALKFGVIFQKLALKLIKICKIIWTFEKNANFSEILLNFLAGNNFLII